MDDTMQNDRRKALYETVAEEMPLVKEVLSGSTTFSDSLDQIAAGIEYGDDDAASAFGGWYSAVGTISGAPLGIDQLKGFMDYYGFHSKKVRDIMTKQALTAGGASAFSLGLGFTIGRILPGLGRAAAAFKTVGIAGLAATGLTHGAYVMHGKKTHGVADDAMTTLYMAAATLDNEVKDLFFPEPEQPASAESGVAPAEPAHTEVE